VEPEQFNEVCEQLPKHFWPLVTFLYRCEVRVGEARPNQVAASGLESE
jgi:hypothetical protein